MPDTTFTPGTVITSAWLNEVNDFVHAKTNVAAIRSINEAGPGRLATLGYTTAGDGGHGLYWKDAADTTSVDNNITVIVTAFGERYKLFISGPFLDIRQCGVDTSGVTGATDALIAADVVARALKLELLISGRPWLDKQLTLSAPTTWRFVGNHNSGSDVSGPTASTIPASFLQLKGAHPSGQSGVVVSHPGIKFIGGGIGCLTQEIFPYDGITIVGNGFRWEGAPVIWWVGRDGYRIGNDNGTGVYNANSVFLDCPSSCWNGRHGFNISDDDGSQDANTFLINSPRALYNKGHGIRLGKTYLGGTIISPTVENNAVGIYTESTSNGIIIVGGDVEANTGQDGLGPLQNYISAGNSWYTNKFNGTVFQGNIVNSPEYFSQSILESMFGITAYTPTIYGASTAGTATYASQQCEYSVSHGVMHIQMSLKWSGANGSGQMYVPLPDLFPGSTLVTTYPGIPDFIPVQVTLGVTANSSVSAGQDLVAFVNTNVSPPRLQFYLQSAGSSSAWAIPASGDIHISGTIPYFQM